MDHRKRLARFYQLLNPSTSSDGTDHQRVVREELKELSLGGIPDEYRPATYRAFLELPPASTLEAQYQAFVEELAERISAEPAPTIDSKPSKSDKLLREIERDVDRTFGGLAWFGAELGRVKVEEGGVLEDDAFWARIALLNEVDAEKSKRLAEANADGVSTAALRDEKAEEPSKSKRPSTRRQVLLRPLFIYATLNPGLSYVQGMNSLIAVFYWIFSSDASVSPLQAEASSFFALGAILSQLRDLYVPSLDGNSFSGPSQVVANGLGATLARYTNLLNWLDPSLALALESKQVDPALYVFRWLTTWFANEFQLPDLVRVWDRVIGLYPSEKDHQPVEALSPVLGHLIDLSLAMVLHERPTLISPYANFQKVVMILQDPQIGGEDVEKLLGVAWDIRERRLGRASKRSSLVSDTASSNNWRNAANKWATAASSAASTSTTANSIRQRFWNLPTTPSNASPTGRPSLATSASDFDLDDSVSVADSEASVSSIGPSLFASKGQTVGLGSPRRPAPAPGAIHEPRLTVDGKVLPPPPDRIDQPTTLAQLIEDELPASMKDPYDEDDAEAYGVDSPDGSEPPSLGERAASSWGTWRNRFAASDTAAALSKQATNLSIAAQVQAANLKHSTTNLGSSDSYAALSKTTTNLSIQAQLLKEQLANSTTTDRLSKIKETVSEASGRFMASTGSERGPRRPGSPMEEPFTPPRWASDDRQRQFARAGSPTLSEGSRNGSAGPKPLLLSGAARKAGGSLDSTGTSPPDASRRNSIIFGRSPSTSPVMNRSPRLGSGGEMIEGPLVRSNSRSSAAHGRSASHAPALGYTNSSDPNDVPISSLRISGLGNRRPSASEAGRGSENGPSSTPAANGRGWTLTDAPVSSSVSTSNEAAADRLAPPTSNRQEAGSGSDADSDESFHSAAPLTGPSPLPSPGLPSPPLASVEKTIEFPLSGHPSGVTDDIRNMFAASDARTIIPPRDSYVPDTNPSIPPPRASSLGNSIRVVDSPASSSPQRPSISTSSSTAVPEPSKEDDTILDTPISPSQDNALSRSKIVRRPVISGKRRVSNRISNTDMSNEDRRAVSAFLAGENDGGTAGGLSRNGSRTSRRSRATNGAGSRRESTASGWSEADIFDSYGAGAQD